MRKSSRTGHVGYCLVVLGVRIFSYLSIRCACDLSDAHVAYIFSRMRALSVMADEPDNNEEDWIDDDVDSSSETEADGTEDEDEDDILAALPEDLVDALRVCFHCASQRELYSCNDMECDKFIAPKNARTISIRPAMMNRKSRMNKRSRTLRLWPQKPACLRRTLARHADCSGKRARKPSDGIVVSCPAKITTINSAPSSKMKMCQFSNKYSARGRSILTPTSCGVPRTQTRRPILHRCRCAGATSCSPLKCINRATTVTKPTVMIPVLSS